MRQPNYSDNWPEDWKISHHYDLLEVYGESNPDGYAYAYANRRKHTLELIQSIALPKARILDVAAAQGNFSIALAELGYEVTWNDLRENLAEYTKLKQERGIIHYKPGNIFELDFESYFDIALITEIIEHVAHPDDFLRKISKMVKPHGYVVMTTPNGEYLLNSLPRFSDHPNPAQFDTVQFQPNSDGHIFLLHQDEIETLAQQSGLKIIETRFFTNPLTNGHLKLASLLKVIPRSWINAFEYLTASSPIVIKKKIHVGMAVLFVREH